MPSQAEIQKQITDRILEGLTNGTIPWRKPWRPGKNSGSPANVISRRNYSGVNPILLDLVATRAFWGTYERWASLGAQARRRPADCKPGCSSQSRRPTKSIATSRWDSSGPEGRSLGPSTEFPTWKENQGRITSATSLPLANGVNELINLNSIMRCEPTALPLLQNAVAARKTDRPTYWVVTAGVSHATEWGTQISRRYVSEMCQILHQSGSHGDAENLTHF